MCPEHREACQQVAWACSSVCLLVACSAPLSYRGLAESRLRISRQRWGWG